MSRFAERVARDLHEIADRATPSSAAWSSLRSRIEDQTDPDLEMIRLVPNDESTPTRTAVTLGVTPLRGGPWTAEEGEVVTVDVWNADTPTTRRRQRGWVAGAVAASVALVFAGLVANRSDDGQVGTTGTTGPAVEPAGPFAGVWVSTDTDSSSQTMEIARSGEDGYEVVLRDDAVTTCSGAPGTMTGTGLLETAERLVIAQPELTCDDGTVPGFGPPPQAALANFSLDFDGATGELLGRFGVVWRREGSSPTSGGMWPQSTLDEVRAAQELADAGDSAYTWQLDAALAADESPWGAEILVRFIEEELGWEEFSGAFFAGFGYVDGGGEYHGVTFIRCAPGRTNPLASLYADAPPEIRGCAPTIDELTYETVSVTVTQPQRRGPSGIWVVERWEMLQPNLVGLIYPEMGQVEQFVPPSEADVTAFLEAFLQARVDGEGAEQYLLREPEESPFPDDEVPLLYATTSGARFERSEVQRVQGPVWPTGWMEYKVRLFTEGGTVVEQYFHVVRHDGQLGLLYGSAELPTTENGQPVAVPHAEFGGTLTFTAPPLVPRGDGRIEIALPERSDGRIVIGEDPRPDSPVRQDCENGPKPADAEALARRIMADPDFETTEPVPVSIAGIDGLQIDVAFSEQDLCYVLWSHHQVGDPPWRMRLYLIDYPESAWPSEDSNWKVLTVAVIAPEPDFERVLEQATPIVESLEFHPR